MIPAAEVTESVTVVPVPSYTDRSVESCLSFQAMKRHRSTVTFQPGLAPVRFAESLIVYGKSSTRRRYVSRTLYEPRVKASRFAETDFVFPKAKTQRFSSFLDYHMEGCRKWFKTCLELRARTFTTVHNPSSSSSSSTTSVTSSSSRRGDDVKGGDDGPGASQVFIPPCKEGKGGRGYGEREFRVALDKEKVDFNMNGPVLNGF